MRYIFAGKRIKISVFLPVFIYLWTVFSGYEAAVSAAAAVLIHETGHLAAGLFSRRGIKSVTLSLFGADIEYSGVVPYKTDLFIALSGPLASLAAGALLYGYLPVFSGISVIYGLMNLIPVPCFDGGRALRSALYSIADVCTAGRICDTVNVVLLLIMYLFSVFLLFYTSFNASLLLICIYVFADSYVKMKE